MGFLLSALQWSFTGRTIPEQRTLSEHSHNPTMAGINVESTVFSVAFTMVDVAVGMTIRLGGWGNEEVLGINDGT